MTFDEGMKKQKEILDKIDFQPYLDKYDLLEDIFVAVNRDYPRRFDGQHEAICYYGLRELTGYLSERYNIAFSVKENDEVDYIYWNSTKTKECPAVFDKVVFAKWKKDECRHTVCSRCGKEPLYTVESWEEPDDWIWECKSPYCPYCGAMMENGKEE